VTSTLGRREMLSLLLGASLGAEACRYLPRRKIDGAIRGASMSVGHRLRHAHVEQTSTERAVRVPVAIVGAGPSGLSAAWRPRAPR